MLASWLANTISVSLLPVSRFRLANANSGVRPTAHIKIFFPVCIIHHCTLSGLLPWRTALLLSFRAVSTNNRSHAASLSEEERMYYRLA